MVLPSHCLHPQQSLLFVAQQQQVQQYPQVQVHAGTLDLCSAVESLYRDGLKPYGRILRKRLAEQSQAAGRSAVEADINNLRVVCEACPYLQVAEGEGGDWAALLPGVSEAFENVYSPHDCYAPMLWLELGQYFNSLDGADMILPGGRYSCAQVLVQRRLPCLVGYSLGQVCHIVQLAISQKKLLGYLNGMVVPYGRSLSMVKEQSARSLRPCANTVRRSKSSAFATWDMMRPCLQQLLGTIEQPMPLSNVKRLFRAQFHVELSETALGYAKLSECLQDPRVRDLCDVKLLGQGYTIVPKKQRNLISLADSLCMDSKESMPSQDIVRDEGSLLQKRRSSIQHLSMDAIHSPPSSPKATAFPPQMARSSPEASANAAFRAHVCMTPVHTPFPQTPSPSAAAYARSLPRLLGRLQPQPPRLVSMKEEAAPEGKGWGPPQQPGFDRLTLSSLGLAVQNTFLHVPLPPPTPVRADARCRARSLPRQDGRHISA